MNLENLNLVELNAQETISIDGGTAAPSWIKKLGWGYLATQIIDNWDEIKEGWSEGWSAGGNH